MQAFGHLYRLVIGDTGGCFIPQSFHPYQLVNAKGTSVWIAAYAYISTRQEKDKLFKQFGNEGAVAAVPIGSSFTAYHAWLDRRLLPEENPAFSKYVPFVVPFIVWNGPNALRWDEHIDAAVATTGNAEAYLAEVNAALSFLMPGPGFVLGFDEFDDRNPSRLIDHFVRFLPALEG